MSNWSLLLTELTLNTSFITGNPPWLWSLYILALLARTISSWSLRQLRENKSLLLRRSEFNSKPWVKMKSLTSMRSLLKSRSPSRLPTSLSKCNSTRTCGFWTNKFSRLPSPRITKPNKYLSGPHLLNSPQYPKERNRSSSTSLFLAKSFERRNHKIPLTISRYRVSALIYKQLKNSPTMSWRSYSYSSLASALIRRRLWNRSRSLKNWSKFSWAKFTKEQPSSRESQRNDPTLPFRLNSRKLLLTFWSTSSFPWLFSPKKVS